MLLQPMYTERGGTRGRVASKHVEKGSATHRTVYYQQVGGSSAITSFIVIRVISELTLRVKSRSFSV